nr:glycosyltransferase family 8 protein [Hyphomonas sp. Mor2]
MSDRIWVAFGCDAGFAPHVAATIASIVRHTDPNKLHILMMQDGFDDEQKEVIESLADGALFTWIDMSDIELPDYLVSNHISYATLFRLGLEQLAPEACQRLIYLDADLIVMDDLQKLWDVDLKGAAIGGVPDPGLSVDIPGVDQHWREWGDDKAAPYLNAGVMVIDLDQVRRDSGFSKALDVISEHGADLPYQDQDAINWIYWGQWTELPLEWNVQRFQLLERFESYFSAETLAACQDPKIVHFTGPEKPWNMEGYHPWWWVYWDALADTPYFSQVRAANGISRRNLLKIWARWLKKRPRMADTKSNFARMVFKS